MSSILDNPFVVFIVALIAQWVAAYFGDFLRRRRREVREDEREDLDTVQTAILTLLALIVGFSFSMAVTRYDQRKNFEEAEANAIGTQYVRADLLPAADAVRVRELLRRYLNQRINFYETQRRAPDRPSSHRYHNYTSRTVVRHSTRSERPANTCNGPCRFGNERCAELGRIYPGSLVGSYPHRGLGIDGADRDRLQSDDRLQGTPRGRAFTSYLAPNRVNFLLAHRRY